ncbi:chromo domain-containing protein cec-4 [Teleopsis dalmanni]|uniref:chromo domain-containing protein cec-4 n=1 Tax=Teleopsis dalmanni TaxID=139649 RepID=UPI0018CCCC61|nr:chromo domain-containing protein cec-4 [Teleopsis dalmanni]
MGRVHKKKIAEFIGADIGSDAEAMDESDASGGASEENGSDNRRKRSDKKADDDEQDNEESDASVTSNKRQKSLSKSSSVDKADEDTTQENDDSNKKQSRKSSVKTKRGAGKDNNVSEGEVETDEAPKKRARKSTAKEKAAAEEEEEDESEAEPEYEVEAVIDKKVEKGATYYLLTWKGYPKEDATWEPEDSISCPDLVEKFNKKRAAESTKGSKKGVDASKKGSTKKDLKKTASSKAAKAKNGGQADAKEGEATEYEVEKIVDYATEKSGRIFRIRWKGYRPKHDTWEPEDNLTCPELIEKFLKQVKHQEDNSRELREEPKKTKFLVDETQPRTSFRSRIERSSQRSCARQRKFYGDAEN